MNFHICIPIDRAMQELAKGNNLFTGTDLEAFTSLTDALNEGKTYYSGCDNMNADGRCAGHKIEKPDYEMAKSQEQ